MSKPTAVMCCMLSERLQNMRFAGDGVSCSASRSATSPAAPRVLDPSFRCVTSGRSVHARRSSGKGSERPVTCVLASPLEA